MLCMIKICLNTSYRIYSATPIVSSHGPGSAQLSPTRLYGIGSYILAVDFATMRREIHKKSYYTYFIV